MAKFQKGQKKIGGRKKGSVNKLTEKMKTVKETVLAVFHELQDDPKANLTAWGRANPKDFYTIAAKLIPTELTGEFTNTVIEVKDDTK